MEIHDEGNYLVINELYAFVSRDEEGNEGVCGFRAPDGTMLAMVGADLERVESLKPVARELARHTQKSIHLLKFSTRTEMEVISGAPEGD